MFKTYMWSIDQLNNKLKSDISFVECTTRSENKTFETIINTYHSYVKYKCTPNRRIHWLVYESKSGNLVGAIGLSSAVLSISDRDNFIGWNNDIKLKHLGMLANNQRFCIIKKNCTIKNVGSMTLKQLRVIGSQRWFEKYNDRLILLETFVQPERSEEFNGFKTRNGSVYRADNWINIGITKGNSIRKSPLKLWAREENSERGRMARENPTECLKKYSNYLGEHSESGYKITNSPKKIIFVKPLVDNWKEILNEPID